MVNQIFDTISCADRRTSETHVNVLGFPTFFSQMKVAIKFLLNALVAWLAGSLFIIATLYFSNGGVDFTATDIMGFSVLSVIASGILMLAVYTPSLYWLKRRQHGVTPRHKFPLLTGVVCNVPVFIIFVLLIDRKMSAAEAFGFMLTFLVIGVSFGYGFTLARK